MSVPITLRVLRLWLPRLHLRDRHRYNSTEDGLGSSSDDSWAVKESSLDFSLDLL